MRRDDTEKHGGKDEQGLQEGACHEPDAATLVEIVAEVAEEGGAKEEQDERGGYRVLVSCVGLTYWDGNLPTLYCRPCAFVSPSA